MSSKIIGLHGNHFAELIVRAVQSVKMETQGKITYPIGNVGVVKAFGGSYQESSALNGYAMYGTRAS